MDGGATSRETHEQDKEQGAAGQDSAGASIWSERCCGAPAAIYGALFCRPQLVIGSFALGRRSAELGAGNLSDRRC
jgi:hypothetical protein